MTGANATVELPRRWGDWELTLVDGGRLSLDGGSMFGSVPRGIWERRIPPDSEHRIPLALRLLLLRNRADGSQVLVDTGVGDKEEPSFRERFAVEAPAAGSLENALGKAGTAPGAITHLLLTHLHFDHGGGATHRDSSGRSVPAFPGAVHFLQRRNLETARDPNPRERASYLPENVRPLLDVRLELLEGEEEVLPGLRVIPSDGHTDGMQIVRLEGGERPLYYLADLAPTHHHLHLPFTMGYDLCARQIMEEKERVFSRAVDEEAFVIFEHDSQVIGGVLGRDRGRYGLVTPLTAH